MDLNNSNIGQKFYFVDKIYSNDTAVIERGTLKSILPKYKINDSFGALYKREENILFSVPLCSGKTVSKAVTNNNLIFANLLDAVSYCRSAEIDVLFGYSVVMGENA